MLKIQVTLMQAIHKIKEFNKQSKIIEEAEEVHFLLFHSNYVQFCG